MKEEQDGKDTIDSITEKLEKEIGNEAYFSSEEFRKLEHTISGAMIHGELDREPREIAKFTLGRLATDILNGYDEIEEEVEEAREEALEDFKEEVKSQQWFRESLSDVERRLKKEETIREIYDDIVLFFTLSYSIIEDFSADLLEEELITEEFQGSKSTQKLLNRRFSQEMRETLLLKCGILDNGLVSEMGHFRKTRNKLTHDLSEQQFLDPIEEIDSEVNRCIDVLADLSRELDKEAFLVREENDKSYSKTKDM